MAGRPRKSTTFTDVVDISSTEEKKETKSNKTSNKVVEKAAEPTYRYGTVKSDSWLNVRKGPGMSFDIISTLKNGEKVTIYEEKDGFGKISDINDMWVNLDFVV